jgi:hypothetical protein
LHRRGGGVFGNCPLISLFYIGAGILEQLSELIQRERLIADRAHE